MVYTIGIAQVRFRTACPGADTVYLAGDFNDWTIPGVPMQEVEPGVWEVSCALPTGTQRVGYFAIRRDADGGQSQPGNTPNQECPVTDAAWLMEYESIVVVAHPWGFGDEG